MVSSNIVPIQEPLSVLELHAEAMLAAEKYHVSEIRLFEIIAEVDVRKIYFQFEITSLFEYCVELLGLSRHTAYNFINVVRTSLEVPALALAVVLGKITVSKAKKICSVITVSNAKEWIDLAAECSTRVVERAVASAHPRAAVQETLKYISSDVLELRLAVSHEWSELLSETKDLLSQQKCRAVGTEEALFILMVGFKQKRDPVLRAQRALSRRASRAKTSSRGPSRHIPAPANHHVNLKDRGQCSFIDRRGKRCASKRWLQKHHVEHFANGGDHSVENLKTLCWAHHCMAHR